MTFDTPSSRTLTVSAVNRYIKALLVSDGTLSDLWVEGEISNFKRHISGHCYFTLKDAEGVLKCVMFKTAAARLRFMPENGMKVLVRGNISVYERDGAYQLYAEHIEVGGTGALYLAFEQLKEKLSREGLFDSAHKKPIPKLPKRVGVISSPTGAVIRDIMHVTYRRFPTMRLVLFPVSVQGTEASSQIEAAFRFANENRLCDVIILARGGGSLEELWAFNEERTARAIYGSSIPVISAVGHETDYTISDFTADLRAPTPSAAAELAVPELQTLKNGLENARGSLSRTTAGVLSVKKKELAVLRENVIFKRPTEMLQPKRLYLDGITERLRLQAEAELQRRSHRLKLSEARLEALNPMKVLERGYAVVRKEDGTVVSSPEMLAREEPFTVTLKDGQFTGTKL